MSKETGTTRIEEELVNALATNNPIHNDENERQLTPREILVEHWRNAPIKTPPSYDAGTYTDPLGNQYHFDAGKRLLIKQGEEFKEVMDTCEAPWAIATVDAAFKELDESGRKEKVRVLERGWGLGLMARRFMQHLGSRGGIYYCIELNDEVASEAKRWKRNQETGLTTMAHRMISQRPKIEIQIIGEDAYRETERLLEEGQQFDIIASDTFPLDESEQGMNDLNDLETLKHLLTSDPDRVGVFTFYAYYPGSYGGLMPMQRDIINEHFRDYKVTEVSVNPPDHYQYLQTERGPVQHLPVVICRYPKFQSLNK